MTTQTHNLVSESPKYAGVIRRILSFMIDLVIISFYFGALSLIFIACFLTWNYKYRNINDRSLDTYYPIFKEMTCVIIYILYFSILQSSQHRATYGMRILDLQITNNDFNIISKKKAFMQSILLYILSLIGIIYPIICFFMINIMKKKQAPHNILCGTYIIHKTLKPDKLVQIPATAIKI